MKGGFSLLEVLIALTVFAMSVLSIYSLLNTSVNMTQYGKDKQFVVDKGYERILIHIHYPRLAQPSSEEADGKKIEYKYNRQSVSIPTIEKITLTVRSDSAAVVYEYFEKTR